jgi:beta-carotene ketolase (CrtW type)
MHNQVISRQNFCQHRQSLSQSISGKRSLQNQFDSLTGIIMGVILISLWFFSLVGLLRLNLGTVSPLLIIFSVFLRAFLHTGLFITTHEAIHGVISPQQQINNLIGYTTSFLYALLPYKILAKNHQQHHRYPATEKDPDFYALDTNNFLLWYCSFMQKYQEGKQAWILLIGMTIIFWTFIALHIAPSNIFLFWVIPILISSLQLFTFGIFLPHKKSAAGYRDNHRARSNNYSVFWSFVTCYHFGYHWEHHQYPHLPWYKLPQAHQKHQLLENRE